MTISDSLHATKHVPDLSELKETFTKSPSYRVLLGQLEQYDGTQIASTNDPAQVLTACYFATYLYNELGEYTLSQRLFEELFPKSLSDAILNQTSAVSGSWEFLTYFYFDYLALLVERASEATKLPADVIQFLSDFVKKDINQLEPFTLKAKRMYARILLNEYVQQLAQCDENGDGIDEENVIDENAKLAIQMLQNVVNDDPSDKIAQQYLSFILDSIETPTGDATFVTELPSTYPQSKQEIATLSEAFESLFGNSPINTIKSEEVQWPDGAVVCRSYSVSDSTLEIPELFVVHSQGLSFSYLPSPYDILEPSSEQEEDDEEFDNKWEKKGKISLPLNWSGIGYEVFVLTKTEDEWPLTFLPDFCEGIVASGSDLLTEILWESGKIVTTTYKGETLHILLTKLSRFLFWSKRNLPDHFDLTQGKSFLVGAFFVTEQEKLYAQNKSVGHLVERLCLLSDFTLANRNRESCTLTNR